MNVVLFVYSPVRSWNIFLCRGINLPLLLLEITFAPVANVVVFPDQTKPPNYKISNLELEH